MQSALELYQEAKRKLDEAKEVCKANAKAAFSEASDVLFAAHPQLEKFGWKQYTPYFNDGDECEFSAHTDYPFILMSGELEAENKDGEDWEYDEFSSWRPKQKLERGEPLTEKENAGMAIIEFLSAFEEDDYYEMFGDHAKIVVSRGEVEVEEYSHD